MLHRTRIERTVMPDWRTNEGNVRDKYAQTGSGFFQHQNHDQGKMALGVIPDKNNVDLPNFPDCYQDKSAVSLQYSQCHVPAQQIGSNYAVSCEKDSFHARTERTNYSESSQLPFEDAAFVGDDLTLVERNFTYGESDIAYYDWPNIDHFEDVDNLFSKCDSMFGEQQIGNSDELPWFPSSSDSFYTSEITTQPDVPSTYSEFDVLNDLAYHCSDDKPVSTSNSPLPECDQSLFDDYLFEAEMLDQGRDTDTGTDQVPKVKEFEETDNNHSDCHFTSNDYCDLMASQLPVSVCIQNSSQHMSEQKHTMTSCHNTTSHRVPRKKDKNVVFHSSTLQDDEVKLQCTVERDVVMGNHLPQHAITSKAPVHGTHHRLNGRSGHKGQSERCFETSPAKMESPMVVDSPASLNESSIQELSLRQLQDAMNQLDVNTKLCIRDGLYRLARSVRQRSVFRSESDPRMGNEDAKHIQDGALSPRFAGPINVETNTNPIDRSIALLLFHRPSDQVAGAIDDASSAKSHVIDESRGAPVGYHQQGGRNQQAPPVHSRVKSGSSRSMNARHSRVL